jgi:hypothetical protein
MAVAMKNAVFWDVTPCGFCKNRRHIVLLLSVRRLLGTANVGPSSPILVTVVIETLRSPETSVLTRSTRRNIREDGIFVGVNIHNSVQQDVMHVSFAFESMLFPQMMGT